MPVAPPPLDPRLVEGLNQIPRFFEAGDLVEFVALLPKSEVAALNKGVKPPVETCYVRVLDSPQGLYFDKHAEGFTRYWDTRKRLYFCANPVREGITSGRAKAAETPSTHALVIDVDPPKGGCTEDAMGSFFLVQEWLTERGVFPPWWYSGRGLQTLLLHERLEGEALLGPRKRLLQGLSALCKDGCKVDPIFRGNGLCRLIGSWHTEVGDRGWWGGSGAGVVSAARLVELADEINPLPKPEPYVFRGVASEDHALAYANGVLRMSCERLVAAPEGERNNTANAESFNCGQFAEYFPAGAVARQELVAAAISVGLEEGEAIATVQSGWTSGSEYPRHPPAPRDRSVSPPAVSPLPEAAVPVGALRERVAELFRGEGEDCYPLRWDRLDRMLGGGFYAGELVLLAAQTGQGKSSLAATLAVRLAQFGTRVGFLALESKELSWHGRFAAIAGECSRSLFKRKQNPALDNSALRAEADRGVQAWEDLQSDLILRVPTVLPDREGILAELEALYEAGAQVIFWDYYQRLKVEGDSKAAELEVVSQEVSAFAVRRKVAVVACAQIKSSSEAPFKLSDVRWCQQLGQDASTAILIHADTDNNRSKLALAKSRDADGSTLWVTHLVMNADQGRFYPPSFAEDISWSGTNDR